MPILVLLFLIWLAMQGNLGKYWKFASVTTQTPNAPPGQWWPFATGPGGGPIPVPGPGVGIGNMPGN